MSKWSEINRKYKNQCSQKCYQKYKTLYNKKANELRKRRKHFIELATPNNIEIQEQLKNIYMNRPKNYDVDHIIPLNHPLVCGLHVPWNLQYLTKEANSKKSNKFKPYIEEIKYERSSI